MTNNGRQLSNRYYSPKVARRGLLDRIKIHKLDASGLLGKGLYFADQCSKANLHK